MPTYLLYSILVLDLPTIINPHKLAWEQGESERVAQIFPGPPNTTLDRSAIGDHDAQDVMNVTTANGVWELDERYRQFAPSPSDTADTVLTEALAVVVIAHCLIGSDITGAWTA